MLHMPAPFPCTGARAFEGATARPLTILQARADGRLMCRRDDVARVSESVGGSARGTVTLDRAAVFASAAEALTAAPDIPGILTRRARKLWRCEAETPSQSCRGLIPAGAYFADCESAQGDRSRICIPCAAEAAL